MYKAIVIDGLVSFEFAPEGTVKAKNEWMHKYMEQYKKTLELQSQVDDLIIENNNLKDRCFAGRENELQNAIKVANKTNEDPRRVIEDRGTHDKSMIESFDERTPEELAKLVEFELELGSKTTFSAGCLVLMYRRLQSTQKALELLAERHARIANIINCAD